MVKSKENFIRIKPSSSSKDGIDRITNLPEPLISQILSLLPTKNAVATTVLSRRWKFSWTSITCLDIRADNSRILSLFEEDLNKKRTKFTQFVNRVLLLITPPCIQKFRFDCTEIDPSYLSLWITAVAKTVQELDLTIYFTPRKHMELPLHHFQFSKLMVLKLFGDIDFIIPAQASVCFPSLRILHSYDNKFSIASNSSVSFPSLKILCFCNVESVYEDSLHKLFSSCPVLDDLEVSTHSWKNILGLIFCIPSLTRLTIDLWGHYYDLPNDIQINKLHKLKYLSVSSHAVQAITTTSANISLDFHNLKRLDLDAWDCNEWCVEIKNLLKSMDNLEHLVFKRKDTGCSEKFGTSWRTEPSNVPECLKSRVTTICFTQMMDECDNEIELVRYLLKNAKVLQVFKLRTESISLDRKFQLIQKISMFPRGSQACQVEFT